MTHSLLLEIGCEDLPARYVLPLAGALARGMGEGLSKRGVGIGVSTTFATPRRIAVRIDDVADRQPDQSLDLTGPALGAALKDGQPTAAALGFARKCGVEFAALRQKDGKLHYAKTSPGRATTDLIGEIFEDTLKQMDELVPKRMRWGEGIETFVRPVEWLCCLFGNEVVALKRFGLEAGRVSYGHRFHAPQAIPLVGPADYAPALRAARVWADMAERKAEIRRQIEAAAASLGGHARITEDLLDEVTALVELPVAIAGQFEARFLDLPPEVIVATVETNQRYFTVFQDAEHTTLTRHFITVSNIESRDVAQVIQGNERVVRPRLTDALFFCEQDLKQPLADYAAKLESVTFQKDLGSIGAKVQRIAALAPSLASHLGGETKVDMLNGEWAVRAAQLCKADLVTKVVYEFPELQGLMGGYYAAKAGEHPEVVLAIREHYLPTQQGTPIPSTRAGQLVALADKLDTLAGIFAIGQKPSASKDPFALRRAALGVLRICIEGGLPLDLRQVLAEAVDMQPAGKRDAALVGELFEFVMERLRGMFSGFPAEEFEAVKALGISVPNDFGLRLQVLNAHASSTDARALAQAHKRARNILKQAHDVAPVPIRALLFKHDSEHRLAQAVGTLSETTLASFDYAAYFGMLVRILPGPVSEFFTHVLVNDDDPSVRANRIALLRELDVVCRKVADISLLPG